MSDETFTPPKGESLWSDAYQRLKKDKLAVVCFWVIVAYLVVAFVAWTGSFVNGLHADGVVGDDTKAFADAYLFADYDATDRDLGAARPDALDFLGDLFPGDADDVAADPDAADPDAADAESVSGHLLGTNIQGQNILSRIANGTRIALSLGLCVAIIAIVIGAVLGSMAGWFGGWVDEVIVWLYSTVSSIPSIMLIMALAWMLRDSALGHFGAVFLAMGLTYWVGVCRVVRGEFMKLKDRDYVMAARASGFGNTRIMLGHVLPNTAHLLIISFTLLFVWAIKAEVIISFLGVGFLNDPSWGLMIQDAESELTKGLWWQMTFTSVALFGIVLAFQVFGDSLRDALDPRLRQ